MAALQAIERQREGADVYHGAELCKKKSVEMLEEMHLPKGLLPLSGLEEVGYNRATGFVWMKQRKATQHVFKTIDRKVSYATDVTAYVEDRRMKQITGVKTRELLIWVSVSDIYIDGSDHTKITFKTNTGIWKSYPVSVFEEEEEEKV